MKSSRTRQNIYAHYLEAYALSTMHCVVNTVALIDHILIIALSFLLLSLFLSLSCLLSFVILSAMNSYLYLYLSFTLSFSLSLANCHFSSTSYLSTCLSLLIYISHFLPSPPASDMVCHWLSISPSCYLFVPYLFHSLPPSLPSPHSLICVTAPFNGSGPVGHRPNVYQ